MNEVYCGWIIIYSTLHVYMCLHTSFVILLQVNLRPCLLLFHLQLLLLIPINAHPVCICVMLCVSVL